MDILGEEIARRKAVLANKRKQLESSNGEGPAPKKYMSRGEIERERREQLARKQELAQEIRSKKAKGEDVTALIKEKDSLEKNLTTENNANKEEATSSNSSSNSSSSSGSTGKPAISLPPAEVMKRLRAYGEPIMLFGETDSERMARLHKHEVELQERAENTVGRRNLFQDILEKQVEQDLMEAVLKEAEKEEQDKLAMHLDEKERAELAEKKKIQQAEEEAMKAARHDPDKAREEFENDYDYLRYYFKRLLKEWEIELSERSLDERKTINGRMQAATQKQTREYMKPLFRLLKTKTLGDDLLDSLTKIVKLLQKKEYTKANEEYMVLSIGNAAWPMGVTMVGIHERAGREKIFSKHTAHVLNDETQRKYVQSVKRLMTYAEHLDAKQAKAKAGK